MVIKNSSFVRFVRVIQISFELLKTVLFKKKNYLLPKLMDTKMKSLQLLPHFFFIGSL